MVIDETEQNNFQLTDTSIFGWLRIWKCKLFKYTLIDENENNNFEENGNSSV